MQMTRTPKIHSLSSQRLLKCVKVSPTKKSYSIKLLRKAAWPPIRSGGCSKLACMNIGNQLTHSWSVYFGSFLIVVIRRLYLHSAICCKRSIYGTATLLELD